MTSTFNRTSSSARVGKSFNLPSAKRHSTMKFLVLYVAQFSHTAQKCAVACTFQINWTDAAGKKANAPNLGWLLRNGCWRPRCCGTNKGDELAPPHCRPQASEDCQSYQLKVALWKGPTGDTNDVRFGSKADICSAKRHVRFTPESDTGCVLSNVREGPTADISQCTKLCYDRL